MLMWQIIEPMTNENMILFSSSESRIYQAAAVEICVTILGQFQLMVVALQGTKKFLSVFEFPPDAAR